MNDVTSKTGLPRSFPFVPQKYIDRFFLQPHPLYPMSETDFAYWVKILRQNFPDNPRLADVYKTWRLSGGAGLRRTLPAWLRRLLARCIMRERPREYRVEDGGWGEGS